MAEQLRLARLLAAFARVSVTDFASRTLLHALCEQAPQALGVTGVGVMLRVDADLQLSTASDERIARVAALQSELGEGPCHDAFTTGQRVEEPSLATSTRWPRFAGAAAAAGMASVYAFPLEASGQRFGSLEVYRDHAPALDVEEIAAAQIVADVTATYLEHAREVDDLRRAQARLRHDSLHDALTGLPNRTLLVDRLTVAVAKARRHSWDPAVLFCDLDGFKAVNDRLGHHAGDDLLVAVTERLRRLLRPGDTLARLSGDEFVVVLEDAGGPDEATTVAHRMLSALQRPFVIEGSDVRVDASVGIATAGEKPVGALDLLRRADTAMYRAKSAGGSSVVRYDG